MTTSERDFDRIARAWLDLGPNEAPDRAVDAVLQAIESTPQVRRPVRWPTLRSQTMTRLPLLAVLAGLVILAVGGLLMSGGAPAPAPVSTPTPSASATPSAAPTGTPSPVPDALIGGWVAAARGIETITPGATQVLTFGNAGGQLEAPSGNVSNGQSFRASVEPSGGIRLTTSESEGPCEIGDVGTYDVEIVSATQLQVTALDDACTARIPILGGLWHRSLAHASLGGPGVAANFIPILEFTLPEGGYTGRGDDGRDEIVIDSATATYKVFRDLDGFVDPCDIDKGRLLIEPGMDALLAYFEGDPRFEVTRREEYELDGHRAVEIDVEIGVGLEEPCWAFDGNTGDRRGVLTWVPQGAPDGAFWNDQIGGRDTLVITEVNGATLMFEFLTFQGDDFSVDRETLSTVRFLEALPEAPGS
jgi:hypothetical protein